MSGFDYPDLSFILPFIRLLFILLIPIGVILLLYGYKIFKLFLALLGFILGFSIGAAIGAIADQIIITAFLSGLLGSIIFYFLYRIGIFLLGLGAGIFLAALISLMAGDPNPYFIIIIGLAGGIGALFIEKAIIVFFSSYQGASLVIAGLAWILFPEYQLRLFSIASNFEAYIANATVQILLTLLLTVFGILYQYHKIPRKLDQYLPQFLKQKVLKRDSKETLQNEADINNYSNNRYHYETITSPASDVYVNPERDNKDPSSIEKQHRNDNQGQFSDPIKSAKIESDENDLQDTWMDRLITQSQEGHIETTFIQKPIEFPCQIEILSGPEAGFTNKIYGIFNGDYYSATIGRKESAKLNHIQISDPDRFISREHAEFALKDNHVYVRSLSSVNPLYLNDITVSDSVFEPINNYDTLKMGQIQLSVLITE